MDFESDEIVLIWDMIESELKQQEVPLYNIFNIKKKRGRVNKEWELKSSFPLFLSYFVCFFPSSTKVDEVRRVIGYSIIDRNEV